MTGLALLLTAEKRRASRLKRVFVFQGRSNQEMRNQRMPRGRAKARNTKTQTRTVTYTRVGRRCVAVELLCTPTQRMRLDPTIRGVKTPMRRMLMTKSILKHSSSSWAKKSLQRNVATMFSRRDSARSRAHSTADRCLGW